MVCAKDVINVLGTVKESPKSIFVNEISNAAAFKKLWTSISSKSKVSKIRPNELVKGFNVIATRCELLGLSIPNELKGKSVFDPKTGRIIVLLDDGKEALLLEF